MPPSRPRTDGRVWVPLVPVLAVLNIRRHWIRGRTGRSGLWPLPKPGLAGWGVSGFVSNPGRVLLSCFCPLATSKPRNRSKQCAVCCGKALMLRRFALNSSYHVRPRNRFVSQPSPGLPEPGNARCGDCVPQGGSSRAERTKEQQCGFHLPIC